MRDLTGDRSPLDSYLQILFPGEPSTLFHQSRQYAQEMGKAGISLGPAEARLMATLIRSHQCKKFVEIGTLTGTSALWILQALGADGELWTFEKDLDHIRMAKDIFHQFQSANSDQKIHLIEGDLRETLKSIEAQGPFDGIFIDGPKAAYGDCLDWAEKNLKKGALILADNVFLSGGVFTGNTATFSKKQIEVMREFNLRLANPEKYLSAIVPTDEGLFAAIKLF